MEGEPVARVEAADCTYPTCEKRLGTNRPCGTRRTGRTGRSRDSTDAWRKAREAARVTFGAADIDVSPDPGTAKALRALGYRE